MWVVLAESFERQTTAFWKTWSRGLSIPLDRQEAVIRAAITLKLCSFEETGLLWKMNLPGSSILLKCTFPDSAPPSYLLGGPGALVSSLTTSIPSGPHDRATDSRFCWIRDAFFVVDGLNQVHLVVNFLLYISSHRLLFGAAWWGVRPSLSLFFVVYMLPHTLTKPSQPHQLGATDALQQYLKYLRNLIADFSVRKPDFLEPGDSYRSLMLLSVPISSSFRPWF